MNMKHTVGIFIAFLMATGCAFIAGRNDVLSPTGGAELRLLYVETLRNEASLRGESLRELANATDPATTLQRPNSVFADAFRVYVTDTYPYKPTGPGAAVTSARVFVFERGERTVRVLDSTKDVRLLAPSGIAVDATGVIFVSDSQQGRVFGYDRNGRLLMEIGRAGDFSSPSGLAVDSFRNRLYVADSHARQVKVYTTATGNRLSEISGSETTGFKFPTAITLDRAGNLYVLDGRGLRVVVYDPDGKFVRAFGISGGVPGISVRPRGIAADSAGHVYVTDSVNNNVLIFDVDGTLLRTWGRTGALIGDFLTPAGIFIGDHDYIYIADQTNGRVQIFQYIK